MPAVVVEEPVRKPQSGAGAAYAVDPYTWSKVQADALRRRDFAAIDWENVAEEIETVGRSEKRALASYCERAVEHLLKIECWGSASAEALAGWEAEVGRFRAGMADALADNPGLKAEAELAGMYETAWRRGRSRAAAALAGYEVEGGTEYRPARRAWTRELAAREPYLLEDVAGFDPRARRLADPDPDRMPPAVDRVLDQRGSRGMADRARRSAGRDRDR